MTSRGPLQARVVQLTVCGTAFRLAGKSVTVRLSRAFDHCRPVPANPARLTWFREYPELFELESARGPLVLVPDDGGLVLVAGRELVATLTAAELPKPVRLWALLLAARPHGLSDRDLVDLFRTLCRMFSPGEARSRLVENARRVLEAGGWLNRSVNVRCLLGVSRQAAWKIKRAAANEKNRRSAQIPRPAMVDTLDRGAVASRAPRRSRRRSPASRPRRVDPRPGQLELEMEYPK